MFRSGGHSAAVFRIEPAKVLAFAKSPHAQTRFRFAARRAPAPQRTLKDRS
jgi:hypothetical protein